MNRQPVWLEAKARNFTKTPKGVSWEAVIFSSEFNRNRYFFDIYKLNRWKNKLQKVLMNNDHNGRYFAYSTDGITSLNIQTDDSGITEVSAKIDSTNEEKVKNPEMVTGFSIELLVAEEDVIANENGEYYKDYEWVGMAYLNGILAGSGDSRILSTKLFSQNNLNNIMTEQQVKDLLEAQKTELKAEFTQQTETLKKEFGGKVISQDGSQSSGSYSWFGEDGKLYTQTYESISKSIMSVFEPESSNSSEPAIMTLFAKKFGYVKADTTETPPTTTPETNLEDINKNLARVEEHSNKLKNFNSEEQVTEPETPTVDTAKNVKSFLNKFRN